MRSLLTGFVLALSHPLAVAIVVTANLAVFYGLGLAARSAQHSGILPAIGAAVLVLVAGRAWRALALATALPRVTAGMWLAPAPLIVRAWRLLALDAVEAALCGALTVAALTVIATSPGIPATVLGLAPMLWLALAAFAAFRVATLQVAAAGQTLWAALAEGVSCALGRPKALLALQSWLSLGLVPLAVAAVVAGSPLCWAAAAGASVLWAYASLDHLVRVTAPDGSSSRSSSPGGAPFA